MKLTLLEISILQVLEYDLFRLTIYEIFIFFKFLGFLFPKEFASPAEVKKIYSEIDSLIVDKLIYKDEIVLSDFFLLCFSIILDNRNIHGFDNLKGNEDILMQLYGIESKKDLKIIDKYLSKFFNEIRSENLKSKLSLDLRKSNDKIDEEEESKIKDSRNKLDGVNNNKSLQESSEIAKLNKIYSGRKSNKKVEKILINSIPKLNEDNSKKINEPESVKVSQFCNDIHPIKLKELNHISKSNSMTNIRQGVINLNQKRASINAKPEQKKAILGALKLSYTKVMNISKFINKYSNGIEQPKKLVKSKSSIMTTRVIFKGIDQSYYYEGYEKR